MLRLEGLETMRGFLIFVSFLAIFQQGNTDKLLAVGGYSKDTFWLNDVEIVDLNPDSANCEQPSAYPLYLEGAVSLLIDGEALFCGGYNYPDTYFTDCNVYNFEFGYWKPHESHMITGRAWSRAVMLDEDRWWITGGSDGSYYIDTTEVYSLRDKTFLPYVDLPVETDNHLLLKLNSTHFFLCCGLDMGKAIYVFDLDTETWTQLPDSQYDHQWGFGGLITRPDGTQEVLISTGYYSTTGNVTEIFDPMTQTWREGPQFPNQQRSILGQSLQYQDSFLAIGGEYVYFGWYFTDAIYYFDPAVDQWTELEATLEIPKNQFSAVLFPDEFCSN